jgi:peptide/nickel transport system substrate-binding protein
MRNRLALLPATAMVVAGLAACSGDEGGDGSEGGAPRKGGAITISQTSQPDYMDPAMSYTVNGWEPMWLVYTPLVTYRHAEGKEGTELIPGLAEELPAISEDGLRYELTVRKGLEYSDGTPVRASDFEHTIKRVLNLESGGSAFYEVIEGATEYVAAGEAEADIPGIETNDRTREITITLTQPDGTFSTCWP